MSGFLQLILKYILKTFLFSSEDNLRGPLKLVRHVSLQNFGTLWLATKTE